MTVGYDFVGLVTVVIPGQREHSVALEWRPNDRNYVNYQIFSKAATESTEQYLLAFVLVGAR